MPIWTRRSLLRSALAGAAAISARPSFGQAGTPSRRKGRIRQSVSRWCYKDTPLDKLCAFAKEIGLSGVDLLPPADFEAPRRYGLVCTMAAVPGVEITDGFNRMENHAMIEEKLRAVLPLAAKAGIERVVTFSGNRRGMNDEEGLKNTIRGLKRVKKSAKTTASYFAWNCSTANATTLITCATTPRGACARCRKSIRPT